MAKQTDKERIQSLQEQLDIEVSRVRQLQRDYSNASALNEQLKRDKIALIRTLHILTEN